MRAHRGIRAWRVIGVEIAGRCRESTRIASPVECAARTDGAALTVWANVAHEERACKRDEDCTIVRGDGSCFNAALNIRAAVLKQYKGTPCGNPASGACMRRPLVARCVDGCCDIAG